MATKKKTKRTAAKPKKKATTKKKHPSPKKVAKKTPKKKAPHASAQAKAKPKASAKPAKKPAQKKPAANGFETTLPELLSALHEIEIDYAEDQIDLEPFQEFLSPDETTSWIRAWTGNHELEGHEYRVFAQDGTGGYAAFWLTRDGAELLEQPIVFFGSEGELSVIARNFEDYVWVLAGGHGPYEVSSYGQKAKETQHPKFHEFANTHAPHAKKSLRSAVTAAQKEFPHFEKHIRSQVRNG